MNKTKKSKCAAMWHWLIGLVRCLSGVHNVNDGSTCRLSKSHWNVHDYHESKGGDGQPSHFHEYECPKCNGKFSI